MEDKDDREMLVRIDERVKTVFNKMDDFELMFTNHLHHHEMWENDIKSTMKWWMGIMFSIMVAIIISERGMM
mgnify:CR=1 FL=1